MKSKKSVKQIAQELKCFQYITFHEEYCFRAMFPLEEYEWIDYIFLIFQTYKKYIGFFDPDYILEKDFLEHDNTGKAFNIDFPCSLLDVIITVGKNSPIMQPVKQDENFEAYVKRLFNTAENTITKIDINNFEKTDNLSEQTFMNKDSYKNRFIQFFFKKIVMFLLLIKKFFSIFLIF